MNLISLILRVITPYFENHHRFSLASINRLSILLFCMLCILCWSVLCWIVLVIYSVATTMLSTYLKLDILLPAVSIPPAEPSNAYLISVTHKQTRRQHASPPLPGFFQPLIPLVFLLWRSLSRHCTEWGDGEECSTYTRILTSLYYNCHLHNIYTRFNRQLLLTDIRVHQCSSINSRRKKANNLPIIAKTAMAIASPRLTHVIDFQY